MVGNSDVHTETGPTTRKHLKHVDPDEACPSKCIIPRFMAKILSINSRLTIRNDKGLRSKTTSLGNNDGHNNPL